MFLFVLCCLSESVIILDYRFGKNYGNVFYDYSGNQKHGINGNGGSLYLGISTDRGIYLKNSNYLEVPDSVAFPLSYSLHFWVLAEGDGSLFTRGSRFYRHYIIARGGLGEPMIFKDCEYTVCNKLKQDKSFFSSNHYLEEWVLISFTNNLGNVILYQNGLVKIQTSLSYQETVPRSTCIGASYFGQDSVTCFIWRFVIDSTLNNPSSYFSVSVQKCLIVGAECETCTLKIKDPDYGDGCLSGSTSSSSNSLGKNCGNTGYGCSITTLLSCSLAGKACIYDASKNQCFSKDLITGTETQVACSCLSSFMSYNLTCQNFDCGSKDTLNQCTSCIASNTLIKNGRCYCKDGYYGTLLLNTINACSQCTGKCKTCSSSTFCLTCTDPYANAVSGSCTCKSQYYLPTTSTSCVFCGNNCPGACSDLNAINIDGKCICIDGYFNQDLTNVVCKSCDSECETCTSLDVCTSCSDTNANLNSGMCSCIEGYFKTNKICVQCPAACKSCISGTQCTTCFDINADQSLGPCMCKKGYFSVSLTTCKKCGNGCADCDSDLNCFSCKDDQAYLNGGICDCPIKFTWGITYEKCEKCGVGCLTCNSSFHCSECYDSKWMISELSTCICIEGYYFDTISENCLPCLESCKNCSNGEVCEVCLNISSFGETCQSCSKQCLTCSGPEDFQCLSCLNSSFLNGFCFESCPLGFVMKGSACEINETVKIFSLNFESFGKYFDLVNNFTVEVKNKRNSRFLLDSGIKTAYKRGIYCKGSDSLVMKLEKSIFFAQSFAFSLWVNPLTESGVLFARYKLDTSSVLDDSKELQSVYIESNKVKFRVSFGGNFSICSSSVSLRIRYWNHVFTSVEFETVSTLKVRLNNFDENIKVTVEGIYKDEYDSLLMIANDYSFNNPFHGFIFLYEIFSTDTSFNSVKKQLSSNSCSGCQVCPVNNECINNCLFEEFYDEETDSCKSCGKSCEYGCKSFSACDSCADKFCVICSSLDEKSCIECESGYEVIGSQCLNCTEGKYYDSHDKKCKNCQGLCLTCTDEDKCIKCKDYSSRMKNYSCVCDEGFEDENNQCIQGNFSAKLWISKDFEIHLVFEESLKNDLKTDDIEIKIEKELITFELEKQDMKNFILIPSLTSTKKVSVEVFLKNRITSVKNHVLTTKYFNKVFKTGSSDETSKSTQQQAKTSKAAAQSSAAASASASLTFSLLTMDPSSFFDFMNTAEIFYSVYLFNFKLNPILQEFLLNYRVQGYIPNAFVYIIDEKQAKKLPKKLRKFGYSSNLALVNLGPQLQTLIFFLLIWTAVKILSCFSFCNRKLEKTREKFKFGVFLRIWIQTFFECLIACFVSFYYNRFENSLQVVDFSFTVLLALFQVFMVFFLLYLLRRKSSIRDPDEKEQFDLKYGVFFEEFKEEGAIFQLFYFFFILRRIVLLLCYVFIEDAMFQMAISISYSVILPYYILWRKVFTNKGFNYYHISNEVIISTFHFVLFSSFLQSDKQSDLYATVCYYLILMAVGLNMAFSSVGMIKDIIAKIKKCLNRRKTGKVYEVSGNTEIVNKTSIVSEAAEGKPDKIKEK